MTVKYLLDEGVQDAYMTVFYGDSTSDSRATKCVAGAGGASTSTTSTVSGSSTASTATSAFVAGLAPTASSNATIQPQQTSALLKPQGTTSISTTKTTQKKKKQCGPDCEVCCNPLTQR